MNTEANLQQLREQIKILNSQINTLKSITPESFREMEERWQLVLKGTNDGIWDWNLITNDLFVSSRWKEMLGYNDNELPNHFNTWYSLLHPKDQNQVVQTLEDYLAQKIPHYSVKFRLKTKGGSYKWILSRGQAIWDQDGNPLRMAGSHTDISEQKETEESLELEKTLLRSVIDCIPDAIFYKDHRGIYLACNQAFQALLNRADTDIIGATDFDLFDSNQAMTSREQDQQMITQKKSQRTEEWVISSDGSRRLFDTLKTPLFDYGGIVIGSIGISRDITDRKQKEAALHQQAERNRLLSRVARQLIDQNLTAATQYTLEEIGKFTHSDRTYIIHYDGDKSEWIMTDEWFYQGMQSMINKGQHTPVTHFPWFSQQLLAGNCLKINQLTDLPIEAIAERKTFESSPSPTRVVVPMICGGQPLGYLGLNANKDKIWTEEEVSFLRLVGEFLAIAKVRSHAEESLKQAKEEADTANRAKSEFLAGMSHELRTPLNAILGFTQVMNRDPDLSQEQQENISIISRSGEHLLELINDILEMSKIEAGRTTFNPSNFDLYQLLDGLETLLRLKAADKKLQLIFERDINVERYIKTDESKLRQVLLNLLGNALKFTDEGGIILRVKQGSQPNTLFFEVEDTGHGIANSEIDQLFEAFGQTETGRKIQQGTGLGLPISQKFVQLMGGEIKVSSTVGQGSIFGFNINIEKVSEKIVKRNENSPKVIGLAPNQPEYRILVVDDRWESRQLLLKLLQSVGFLVKEASNGQEAFEIWQKWQPNLIWMDMRMPVMDGYETTQRIKKTAQGQATAIIALTASAFAEERQGVLSAGCDDFMRKPFREEILWQKMAKYLGVKYQYETSVEKFPPTLQSKSDNLPQLQQQLQQMSEQWQSKVRQAALECRDDQIMELLDELPADLLEVKQKLQEWGGNYLFDKIIDFMDKVQNFR
ncbi:MAG: PAS domain S-box protein [Microcystaceae cyanobacterium]